MDAKNSSRSSLISFHQSIHEKEIGTKSTTSEKRTTVGSLFSGNDSASTFTSAKKNGILEMSSSISSTSEAAFPGRRSHLARSKLNYDNVGFEGRQCEIENLRECMNRLVIQEEVGRPRRKELAFIKGYSGVGKSTLAYTLNKQVSQMSNAIFAHGKFDMNNYDEPYSGIAAAFGEIVRVLERDSNFIQNISDDTLSELGSELQLLGKVIPRLENLFPANRLPSGSELESFDFEAGLERWKFAFRVLTRFLNSQFSLMILVLDDLQWADVSSLAVLEYLISDTQNPHPLMIIGCYRSNEVDESHILSAKILSLSASKMIFDFNITYVELRSLQPADVNKIIMAMLSKDDEEDRTKRLAEICHKRTLGNPFFLIEFITMLEIEGLISFVGDDWVWDEIAVEDETMSTANVVELLLLRMNKMQANVRLLLQYAASIGASFKVLTLELLWKNHAAANLSITSNAEEKTSDIIPMLTKLEKGHFIECCGDNTYRWVHDKVQEAALALGDATGLSFQFEIGSILYRHLGEEELEKALFEVMDLINKGLIDKGNTTRKSEYAVLNLKAAEKAKKISAFQSAAAYASIGISLLPREKWVVHRDLTLHLYTLAAQMSLALGRVEMMETYSNEVLYQGHCSIDEKLSLYMAKCHKLSNMDLKYEETIEFCNTVLCELDCKMILHRSMLPIQASVSLLRTVRLANSIPAESWRQPKRMTDPKQLATVKILDRLSYAAYMSQNSFLYILGITTMVQKTINFGICELSGTSFAALGLLTAAGLGDYKAASSFADTAMMIQHKNFHGSFFESVALLISHKFVFPWTRLLESSTLDLEKAYTSGMRSGNCEFALWALIQKQLIIPFLMGKPLSQLSEQCVLCSSQAEELKQTDQFVQVKLLHQVVLVLMGQSGGMSGTRGKFLNLDSIGCTTAQHEVSRNSYEVLLLNILGDFDQAANIAIEIGDAFSKSFPGEFSAVIETFHRSLSLYAMARRSNEWKYKWKANKIRKTVKNWIQKGNPNVRHYYLLLSAEHAALKKNNEKAKSLFKEAIKLATQSNNLRDAALSNERLSEFLFQAGTAEEEEGHFRLKEAIRFYREWGADKKVQLLTNKVMRRKPFAT
jgi:predicted ATPase